MQETNPPLAEAGMSKFDKPPPPYNAAVSVSPLFLENSFLAAQSLQDLSLPDTQRQDSAASGGFVTASEK